MSDATELSAPRDPGSYGRRRPVGWIIWALVVFGLACAAGGYFAARFGPGLHLGKQVDSLTETPPAALLAGPAPAPLPTLDSPALPVPATAGSDEISHRMDVLEADRSRLASAAASALAAAALAEASQTSRPFAQELQALSASAPSVDIDALAADAERGAPSRAALAASFPDYAARAASAARAPGEGAGALARIGYALSRVVTLRRVGETPGSSVDAVLARAERQVGEGDVVAALATLEALPPSAKDALGRWRDRAERRARIDRQIAEIRAQALDELTALARSGG